MSVVEEVMDIIYAGIDLRKTALRITRAYPNLGRYQFLSPCIGLLKLTILICFSKDICKGRIDVIDILYDIDLYSQLRLKMLYLARYYRNSLPSHSLTDISVAERRFVFGMVVVFSWLTLRGRELVVLKY